MFPFGNMNDQETDYTLYAFIDVIIPAVREVELDVSVSMTHVTPRARENVMALTSKIIDVKGRPTEVLEGGAGEPLVFLHGGSMIGGAAFLDAITDRVPRVRAVLSRLRRTELEPPVETRDDVGDHLRDVLDALGLDRSSLSVTRSVHGGRPLRRALPGASQATGARRTGRHGGAGLSSGHAGADAA